MANIGNDTNIFQSNFWNTKNIFYLTNNLSKKVYNFAFMLICKPFSFAFLLSLFVYHKIALGGNPLNRYDLADFRPVFFTLKLKK